MPEVPEVVGGAPACLMYWCGGERGGLLEHVEVISAAGVLYMGGVATPPLLHGATRASPGPHIGRGHSTAALAGSWRSRLDQRNRYCRTTCTLLASLFGTPLMRTRLAVSYPSHTQCPPRGGAAWRGWTCGGSFWRSCPRWLVSEDW